MWDWEPVSVAANLSTPFILACPEFKELGEQWAGGRFWRREQGLWVGVGREHLRDAGIIEGEEWPGVVIARAGWRGSRSVRRLARRLRRNGDEAIVQKSLESLKERVLEGKGKLRSLLSGLCRCT